MSAVTRTRVNRITDIVEPPDQNPNVQRRRTRRRFAGIVLSATAERRGTHPGVAYSETDVMG
jgi:hypothetical protein